MGDFACVCRKKQQRVAAVQDGSLHVNTEQEQRSYEPVFVDAVDTKDRLQPWVAEIRVNVSAPHMKEDSSVEVCCISVEHHRTVCTQQCACTL